MNLTCVRYESPWGSEVIRKMNSLWGDCDSEHFCMLQSVMAYILRKAGCISSSAHVTMWFISPPPHIKLNGNTHEVLSLPGVTVKWFCLGISWAFKTCQICVVINKTSAQLFRCSKICFKYLRKLLGCWQGS